MAGAGDAENSSNVSNWLKRLETVTCRLEELANKNANPICKSAGAVASSSASGTKVLEAFDSTVMELVPAFVASSNAVGDTVASQASLVSKAFNAHRELISKTGTMSKPDPATLQSLNASVQEIIGKVAEIRENSRTSPHFNALSAVSEGIMSLMWVLMEPKPAPYIDDMKQAAQFYVNRVIKEFKDSDKKVIDCVNAFMSILSGLHAFVKEKCTTGLVWNGAATSNPSAAASQSPQKSSTLPPSSNSTANAAALFGQLNKGEGVTAGLKKVDKSQMTHKNPDLRSSSLVKGDLNASSKAASLKSATATNNVQGTPKIALEGNKWIIENHCNKSDIVLNDVELRHVLYVFNCSNCTIQVTSPKCNAITIDGCKKTALVVNSVVSTVDIINCKNVQMQINGVSPTVAIDKTDGVQLFVSKESEPNIEILTAKSSEVNVCLAGATPNDDYVEKAIPEHFKTRINEKGELVTLTIEHSSG